MTSTELVRLIRAQAEQLGVDPDLAEAIAMKESKCAWPKQSTRFEPQFKYFYQPEYFAKIHGISVDTEKREQATSWGPLHIMGAVARECGFNEPLPMLFDVRFGVELALKKLKRLCAKYENEQAVIASYNAGSPRKKITPLGAEYTNQVYVDEVNQSLKKLRAKH